MNNIYQPAAWALAAGMMATACTTTTPPEPVIPNAAIDNATQVVNRAATDPNVAQYAPTELQRAQASLQSAQTSWKAKGDMVDASHLAYLAQQRAVTAMELANQRAAEDAIKAASVERERLQAAAHLLNAQMAQADQLQQDMASLSAQNSERGKIVTLPGERFASGQTELPADAIPTLDRLAAVLKNHPERKVAIEGYTDSQGSSSHNIALSEERANAVRDALIDRGIVADRIIVRPYGKAHPVASNSTPAGRQQNRRTEIVLSDAQGKVPEPLTSSGQ